MHTYINTHTHTQTDMLYLGSKQQFIVAFYTQPVKEPVWLLRPPIWYRMVLEQQNTFTSKTRLEAMRQRTQGQNTVLLLYIETNWEDSIKMWIHNSIMINTKLARCLHIVLTISIQYKHKTGQAGTYQEQYQHKHNQVQTCTSGLRRWHIAGIEKLQVSFLTCDIMDRAKGGIWCSGHNDTQPVQPAIARTFWRSTITTHYHPRKQVREFKNRVDFGVNCPHANVVRRETGPRDHHIRGGRLGQGNITSEEGGWTKGLLLKRREAGPKDYYISEGRLDQRTIT